MDRLSRLHSILFVLLLMTACGGGSGSGSGSGSDSTSGPAEPLTAVDDTASVDQGSSVNIDVLANDSFGDEGPGDEPLRIASAPSNGSAMVAGDDTIDYTPDSDFSGSDSFQYEITDASGDTASATVEVTVNPVTQLEIDITFPTENANLGNVDSTSVSGHIRTPDGGPVEFSDINFIEVNEALVHPADFAPDLWTLSPLHLTGDTSLEIDALVESRSGARDTVTRSVTHNAIMAGPNAVDLDLANGELVVVDNSNALLTIDIATGERTLLSGRGLGSGRSLSGASDAIVDHANDRLIVVRARGGTNYDAVLFVDRENGDRTVLNRGGGPALDEPVAAALDEDRNRLLVADSSLNAVVAVDLSSGDQSILSDSNNGAGPEFLDPRGIALDLDRGRAVIAARRGVYGVDLTFGDRTVIADDQTGNGPSLGTVIGSVAVDVSTERAFVTSVEGMFSIDMRNGDRSVIIDREADVGTDLASPSGSIVDPTTGRLFVVSNQLLSIVDLDVTSGDYEVVTSGAVGSGPRLLRGGPAAIDASGGRIYAVRGGVFPVLFGVDVATGNREHIPVSSGIGGPRLQTVSDLAVDKARGRLVVADSGLWAILTVDLETGDLRILSDNDNGSGPEFGPGVTPAGIAIDEDGDRAIVTTSSGRLLSVDLITGQRRTISGGATGSGPVLDWASHPVLDAENERVLVYGETDSDGPVLVWISLETGSRQIAAGDSMGTGPSLANPSGVALEAREGYALVATRNRRTLIRVDLPSGERTSLPQQDGGPILEDAGALVMDGENRRAFAICDRLKAVMVVNLAHDGQYEMAVSSLGNEAP